MAPRLLGPDSWSMSRDSDGQRDYKIKWLIECNPEDGPEQVLFTPGLPQPGAPWVFGTDRDLWATCRFECGISPRLTGEPNTIFEVEQTFSTKPIRRCQDEKVQDPILEPQKISGNFAKYSEEAFYDRFGRPVINSAWEQMRGPQVEFDKNRPQVKIEQNVAKLNLSLFSSLVDCVNDRTLWGLPPRTIKLSNVSWERKFHGLCYIYYTRNLEFDIRYDTFDKVLLDEGCKVLHGHWHEATGDWVLDPIAGNPPNPGNPAHFDRFKDRNGENARAILDGAGKPYLPSPPTVAGCDECPNGAVQFWNVRGFKGIANPGGDLSRLNIEITYVSGCKWVGTTGDGATVTLEFDHTESVWEINTNILDTTWRLLPPELNGALWQCQGTNLFTRDSGTEGPDTIAIFPGHVPSPGKIFLQKYTSANFLLLGIPLIF